MKVPILFENEDIIAVDKPAGLIVHPDAVSDEESLSEWFAERYPDSRNVGEAQRVASGEIVERSGVVHRLDRDTSGVIILTKNQEAFLDLKRQFQEHVVGKIYNAFVYGNFEEKEGIIDRPIGRSSKDFRVWSAQRGAKGQMRDAYTEYIVLKEGRDSDTGELVAFLEVRPKTGRTHQIRVHMKAINHQIVCDELYAPNRPPVLGLNRLALHARSITFTLLGGENVTIEAPLPPDFQLAFENLGQRSDD